MNTLPRVKKRKGKKMKKMILTMVAMLSMTAAFAEGEKTAEVSNLEAYELNINMNKLSKALGSYILNKYQMRTYLELLNVTTKNRGLIK